LHFKLLLCVDFMKIIGPFKQIISLDNLPLRGRISDDRIDVNKDSGILVDSGKIVKIENYYALKNEFPKATLEEIDGDKIALPAFVNCHTHICFTENEFSNSCEKNTQIPYSDLWNLVRNTRKASEEELLKCLLERIDRLVKQGVSTIEIKSGYGLKLDCELKMLRAINHAKEISPAKIVPTCLAAHALPKDFNGNSRDYLDYVVEYILPVIQEELLSNRVDIFIDDSAFGLAESRLFLRRAKALGFYTTVHTKHFTEDFLRIAVDCYAKSADHIESITDSNINIEPLAKSDTVAVAITYSEIESENSCSPTRKFLDANGILAIATDWNPNNTHENILSQAFDFSKKQNLSVAETLAGITFRAAHALGLKDRGRISKGNIADIACFDTNNYQNILHENINPSNMYIEGERYNHNQ